jgi:hypothetical protein
MLLYTAIYKWGWGNAWTQTERIGVALRLEDWKERNRLHYL